MFHFITIIIILFLCWVCCVYLWKKYDSVCLLSIFMFISSITLSSQWVTACRQVYKPLYTCVLRHMEGASVIHTSLSDQNKRPTIFTHFNLWKLGTQTHMYIQIFSTVKNTIKKSFILTTYDICLTYFMWNTTWFYYVKAISTCIKYKGESCQHGDILSQVQTCVTRLMFVY